MTLGALPAQHGWLGKRRAYVAAAILIALSWLVMVATVRGRNLWDDWWLEAALLGRPTIGALKPWDLFRFATGSSADLRLEQGPAPWFCHPELKIALFRPLSVLTHVIDHHTVGFASVAALAQNLVWLALLVAAAGRLYFRRLSLAIAGVALLLLAIEPFHNEPLGWTSARNALMAAALGFWSLTLHVEAEEEGHASKRWRAVALFALALLAGEVALGVLLFLLSYQALGTASSWRTKAWRVSPYLALTALWLAVYTALGHGTRHSGFYVNPLHEPVAYFEMLPAKFTALAGGTLLGVPPSIWFFRGDLRLAISFVGCFAISMTALALRLTLPRVEPKERRALVWLSVGTGLSLLPQCAGLLGDRSLVVPAVGSAALVAAILVAGARGLRGIGLWGARPLQGLFLLTHVILPPGSLWVSHSIYSTAIAADELAFAKSDLHALQGRRAVLLSAPDPVFALYMVSRLAVQGEPLPVGYSPLSFAEVDHRLTRTAEREFELEQLALPRPGFEQAFRSERSPLSVGETVDVGFMRATVLDVQGRWRKKVRFTFREALDDPKLCFLMWKHGALREVQLPAIGQRLELPREKGPWSLF